MSRNLSHLDEHTQAAICAALLAGEPWAAIAARYGLPLGAEDRARDLLADILGELDLDIWAAARQAFNGSPVRKRGKRT
jgi:hypothetical protein